jgi:hypothetical protein
MPENPPLIQGSDGIPPWQATIEFTIKGTEEECDAKIDKLRAAARRLGIADEFCESEPNCDLDPRERY